MDPIEIPITVKLSVESESQVAKVLEDAPDLAACQLFKEIEEEQYTLGLAYGAMLPDVGLGKDRHQDFAPACVVRRAAFNYLAKGHGVGLYHADGTEGRGTVVESYLWPDDAPDWSPPGAPGVLIKSGDWLLGVQWDDPTWAEIKAGRIRGYSVGGSAHRRYPTPDALGALRR